MRSAPPLALTALIAALAAVLALPGCDGRNPEGEAARPKPKPAVLTAAAARPDAQGGAALTRARVSTKSGEILILEPDGSVSTMQLDSPGGRDAFAVAEADLAALHRGEPLALGGTGGRAGRQTAQDRALEEFAARSQPALPAWKPGTVVDPADFLGVKVASLSPDGRGDLVEVTANLREGVDADLAFSYATCALAGWARDNRATYARHIRTLQDKRNGKLLIGAAFTLSGDRPLGLRVMETNETLRACRDRGIPAA